jgi:SAM-dependent methyltransferase
MLRGTMPAPMPIAYTGFDPGFYDRKMGPLLFEPYADELVARVPARDPLRVLELACGSGIVTRRLRAALPESAGIVATDLNEDMLGYAREAVPAAGIEWRHADMQDLPFADGAFDVVLCQFGFMFPPDKPQAYREARRVLAPGGVLLANVWGLLDENPVMAVMHETVQGLYPDDPPRFYETPYGYGRAGAAADIAAAGWEAQLDDVRLDVDTNGVDLAEGYTLGSPLSQELRARDADPDLVIGAFVEAFRQAYGSERFTMRHLATVITAEA